MTFSFRNSACTAFGAAVHEGAQLAHILDLLAEDSWLNVSE
jgi:hypothetical protein